MAYTHIDCFSGPGGICTGMHAAGFETKVAIEFIKACVSVIEEVIFENQLNSQVLDEI